MTLFLSVLNFSLGGLKRWPREQITTFAGLVANLAEGCAAVMQMHGASDLDRERVRNEAITLRFIALSNEIKAARDAQGKQERVSGSAHGYPSSNRKSSCGLPQRCAHQRQDCHSLLSEASDLIWRLEDVASTKVLGTDRVTFTKMLHSLRAVQFELSVWLERWQDAKNVIEKAAEDNLPLKFFQKITAVASSNQDCPADGSLPILLAPFVPPRLACSSAHLMIQPPSQ